jgi:hypothetical protein
VIFAFSALINDKVVQKCKDKGFNYIIEAPLTTNKIATEIIHNLELEENNTQKLPDIKSRIIGNK